MNQIEFNKELLFLNTFHVKALAKYYAVLSTMEDIDLIGELQDEKLLVLGGGSNILFTDNFEGLVLHNQIRGIEKIKEDDSFIYLKVGGGENWHGFVEYCIGKGYGGVENLALIPGSVGASPIQNIGAYGVEIMNVIDSVNAYHINDKTSHQFNTTECDFGYRDSAFKRKWKKQFIITDVTFKLFKKPVYNISYGAIERQLEKMGVVDLSLRAVADAVISIRRSKLPDPAIIGNAGSFFKNPIVSISIFSNLQKIFPDIVGYIDEKSSVVKIAAGWLIENAGWKGYRRGDAGVHEQQALVLVNYGQASGVQILELSQQIIDSVEEKFGIRLESEVNIV